MAIQAFDMASKLAVVLSRASRSRFLYFNDTTWSAYYNYREVEIERLGLAIGGDKERDRTLYANCLEQSIVPK